MFSIGFQKWFDHERIDFGFFVGVFLAVSTLYLHRLNDARFAQLCFFFDHIKSFWKLVWVLFLSVLQMCPYFLAVGFSNIHWWYKWMQSNFISYVFASSNLFSLHVVKKYLSDYYWKQLFRFPFFLNWFSSFDVILCLLQEFCFEW